MSHLNFLSFFNDETARADLKKLNLKIGKIEYMLKQNIENVGFFNCITGIPDFTLFLCTQKADYIKMDDYKIVLQALLIMEQKFDKAHDKIQIGVNSLKDMNEFNKIIDDILAQEKLAENKIEVLKTKIGKTEIFHMLEQQVAMNRKKIDGYKEFGDIKSKITQLVLNEKGATYEVKRTVEEIEKEQYEKFHQLKILYTGSQEIEADEFDI